MSSVSSRIQLQKLLKTQTSNFRQEPSRAIRSDSLYNLKDFLPNTSSVPIQNRQKVNSTFIPITHNQKRTINTMTNNIEQKIIQQKMNKLKQQNIELQQSLNEQKMINQRQSQQISNLKKLIENMKLGQQKKKNQLSMWSYKYHVQYTPKEKHKYSLAVQTQDIFTSKCQASGSLKAKDFQDIYRRLNSNPSTIEIGAKKMTKQINSLKSTINFTAYNPSTIQNNSTLKMDKVNEGKKSFFKMPKFDDFIEKENKENMMVYSNMNFSKNPMEINIAKLKGEQKPIKQQCLQIYPVEEDQVDMIVGELLCGDFE